MAATFIRPGVATDVPAIMHIIADAKAFLKGQNIDQWQGEYPNEAAVQADIAAGTNRVLVVDGVVTGIASLIPGPDPFYGFIEGTGWSGDVDYYAIHRFAIGNNGRGMHLSRPFMTALISELYSRDVRDVRVDTHPENLIMQHVVTSNGFKPTGTVYLDEPVPERLAYELQLS
jgi:predicted GNAT family N-acyltransferase